MGVDPQIIFSVSNVNSVNTVNMVILIPDEIPFFKILNSILASKSSLVLFLKLISLQIMKLLDCRSFDLIPQLKEIIGLENVPHFTTLQKFFKCFGSHFFDEMLETVELFNIKNP